MHEALCRPSGTTLDTLHAKDGPPITQRTLGLEYVRLTSESVSHNPGMRVSGVRGAPFGPVRAPTRHKRMLELVRRMEHARGSAAEKKVRRSVPWRGVMV